MLATFLKGATATPPPGVTLVDSGEIAAPNTNTNSVTVSLGPAFTNRHIIVCAFTYRGADSRYITAMSLGGNSLTYNSDARDTTTSVSTQSLIASGIVSTGTTATLTFTTSWAVSRIGYFILSASNSTAVALSSSTARPASNSSNVTTTFTSFDTGRYGVVFGANGYLAAVASDSFSYVNATELGAVLVDSGASRANISVAYTVENAGLVNISTTISATYTAPVVAIASWS